MRRPEKAAIHNRFVDLCRNSTAEVCLVRASIVRGLARYPRVWNQHLKPLGVLNLGVSGDGTEHVQWRIENGEVPQHMRYAVIHCGSNNLDRNRPQEIADDLLKIGVTFLRARPTACIFIHGLIPRDFSPFSSRRAKIGEVNKRVRSACHLRDGFVYIEPASEFCEPGGELNESMYLGDGLHLIEAGNKVMARSISEAVRRKKSNAGVG